MSTPEHQSLERAGRYYRFGDFTLDVDSGFLRRGGEDVALPPKPLEVLTYLVEHHGRLVTKTELVEAVWLDTAVTDNSLAQCVLEIRRALADQSQQMIRTVMRRGYVFTTPVSSAVQFPLERAGFPPGSGPSLEAPDAATFWGSLRREVVVMATLVLMAMGMGGMALLWRNRPAVPQDRTYSQITNFTDSATAPVVSPDGRMVAFIRSDDWFLTTDQIFVKLLPNGEPVQLTHDTRLKCCLAFSPDGLRIAFTMVESGPMGWKTYTVSALGGEPTLFLANASGLTWLDQRRVMFSEIETGVHMGIVSAAEDRSEYRKVYFPPHQRSMAHFSYASPDRKWALVLEMNPVWQPCRLIPLDGSSAGRVVGPHGECTSAAWSPDGKWMYFGAEVGGSHHLWRQRFPSGKPEQITFGPTDEEGIAMMPDGRSLVTSIGTYQSAVWIHDSRGERALSSEGHVAPMPVPPLPSMRFSSDGRLLYYLLRHDSPAAASELWRADLKTGKSEAVFRGLSMAEYDISRDGREVVFSTYQPGKPSQLWLASLDRSSPPKLIAASGGASPLFGPDGALAFQVTDGKANYLAQMKKDGSGRSKVASYQVGAPRAISPDGRWIVAGIPSPDRSTGATVAIPAEGGAPRPICAGYCPVAWASDGKFLYVGLVPNSRTSPGKTVAIPVPAGGMLPTLPDSGIRVPDDRFALPGSRLIDRWQISPGPDPSIYAFTKTTVNRNLFRIPLNEP
jgi:DNA-binding winged helix-turn-helix (wHTH) protein/Tol biopolymer transport system component